MWMLLALAAAPVPALANEACVDEEEVDCEEEREELEVRAGVQGMWGDEGPATAVRVQLMAPNDTFLQVDGRFSPSGRALGRVAAGVDVLGGGRAHLDLGLFVGTAGQWVEPRSAVLPQAGGLVGVGYEADRLGLGWQWRAGWGGGTLDELLTENELTLSWRVHNDWRLTAAYLRLNPGKEQVENALAMGVSYQF
ncbi:MAG: hypothetical protein AB8H79_10810 [Myxococcota bacterium]